MHRLLLVLVLLLYSGAGRALDINRASEAELDGVKGIGPALSGRILQARAQAPFRDWDDLLQRVKGVSARSAARLSAAGLTVNGAPYAPVLPPAPATSSR